jgi:hypothetical protein
MPSKHRIFSTLRRRLRADYILSSDYLTMRPYQSCVRFSVLCILSSNSKHCEQYVRFTRSCELAIPYIKLDRF